MELTGRDTILFTFHEPVELVKSLIIWLKTLYPNSQFDIEPVQTNQPAIENATLSQCIDMLSNSMHTILYIYSVPILRKHLEVNGFILFNAQEGPAAIHIRQRHGIVLHLDGVKEVHRDDGPVSPPDPYVAWVCSPVVYEITIVTSGNPSTHIASKLLVEAVINICIA